LKDFVQQNRIFLCLYLIFLAAGGILILKMEQGDEILYFSALHTAFFDRFFALITRLAEAPILILTLILAIRFGYGKGLIAGLNSLLVFLITGFFKFYVFAGSPRPAAFFEGRHQLNFVQGVEVMRYNSLPSGHTSSAFGLFFMFSILATNKRWSYLFFLLALLVGVSRVYLLQHFFRDVYTGSIIGVCTTTIFYLTFARSGFYNGLTWKDKTLLK
jgi:membrane-associated phospholipid phosphatase